MDSDGTRQGDSCGDRERELIEAAGQRARLWETCGAVPKLPAPGWLPGYEIVREIHRGGQGVVYQAVQKSTKRSVAIKVMREGPFAGPHDKARFDREVQILGQLRHPNIVAIHDRCTAGDSFFYVMDYIAGEGLDAWVADGEASIADVLRLFAKICEAVNAAHLQGIIHRDLKPSNVLVDAKGEPHILDFGLARTMPVGESEAEGGELTVSGQLVGSLRWAAPEQAEGARNKIDLRTDVYSLGVMLYQALTDKFPYEVIGNMRDVLDRIMRAEPARPSTLVRQINDEVETIILKCLSKERERRYQSAGELGRDIQRYLAGQPIEAKRDSTLYVLRKTLASHRLAALVAGAFLLLGLGYAVTVTFQSTRLARALERATSAERAAQDERRLAEQARETAETQRGRADERAESARRQLYFNRISLAEAEYRRNHVRSARRSLELCPLDLRHWEWHYLWGILDNSVASFAGHAGWVLDSVMFSPDGRRIAFGGTDNRVHIWDTQSRAELLAFHSSDYPIWALAFSPDGKRIACASFDNHITLWNAESGEELLTLSGHQYAVYSVAFSPDGRRIVSGSQDATARLWDAESGAELRTLRGHGYWVSCVTFSPDGTRIASASFDGTVKVWDADVGTELATLRGHKNSVRCAAFSPDGQRIASASDDGTIKLWNVETGAPVMTLQGHDDWVHSIAFSTDGRFLVSASSDTTIRLWESESGTAVATLRGHEGAVGAAAFSPDGCLIASASMDGTVRLWNTGTEPEVATLRSHRGWVGSVAFSPDGKRIVSCGDDKTIKVWDAVSGVELMTFRGRERSACVSFSADGKCIISAGSAAIILRNARTGEELATLSCRDHYPRCLAVAPNGKRIATGGHDKTVNLWDAETGREIGTLRGHEAAVGSVAFSPDGRRIASASADDTIRLWDAESGEELMTLRGHEKQVSSVAFNRDGSRIVSGSLDLTIRLWDATSGQPITVLRGHERSVDSVTFSPDGKRVASGSGDRTVKLWDAESGDEIMTLRGHRLPVSCVAFSPDGTRIVSSSNDWTIKLWKAAPSDAVATVGSSGGE